MHTSTTDSTPWLNCNKLNCVSRLCYLDLKVIRKILLLLIREHNYIITILIFKLIEPIYHEV